MLDGSNPESEASHFAQIKVSTDLQKSLSQCKSVGKFSWAAGRHVMDPEL